MKLAIAADWLPTYGGAEHVLAALWSVWPHAPIFTTIARSGHIGPLDKADLHTDRFLQTLYKLTGRHQILLPWMPQAMERFDFSGYDVVLSSSHAIGKGVIPPSSAVHVCYCHTPMRYAWEMEDEYLKDFGIRWPFKSSVKRELKRLRRWDLSTAKRVDHFIANSSETQSRINNIYGRDSIVIPPPVDGRFFSTHYSLPTTHYFLAFGRLVPYKRFDLLVDLANKCKLPLKIGGTGSELARLKAMAGPTVEFLGFVPDESLPGLYAGATAVLFPQNEDAGIVPMEAQASGTPVIAFGKGGVLDVVIDGQTGVFASAQAVDAFADAMKKFESMTFDRAKIREHAKKFHIDTFKKRIESEVASALERFRAKR